MYFYELMLCRHRKNVNAHRTGHHSASNCTSALCILIDASCGTQIGFDIGLSGFGALLENLLLVVDRPSPLAGFRAHNNLRPALSCTQPSLWRAHQVSAPHPMHL